MKMNFMVLVIVILFSKYVMAQTAIPPAAGDGSKENPYQIATLENLYWIATDSSKWGYNNYIQTADINASETSHWFEGKGWKPICDRVSDIFDYDPFCFYGIYNGNGHVIDSLFINRPTERLVGLFGSVDNVVMNLGVIHLNITAESVVGGIAGAAGIGSGVSNCYSSGVITAVSNNGCAGGLLGSGYYIHNSYSIAYVNGSNSAGGLVGYCDEDGPFIINSYSRGKINSIISGGLVGKTFNSPELVNSYFAGSVNGSEAAGGLLGLYDSYEAATSGIWNSYWNTDSTGSLTNEYGIGKTTLELKDPFLYTKSPWDSTIWFMDEGYNNGYPYLSWQNPDGTPLPEGNIKAPPAGDGTEENPFQIATLENLCWLALDPSTFESTYFLQVADINAAKTREYGNGEGWLPIGSIGSYFYGYYNGNGHTIDSIFINRPFRNHQGLFGVGSGVIDSIGLTHTDITGHSAVGGLCGYLEKSIENCYSTGEVHGTGSDVGGLVGAGGGYNFEIDNCYSRATVTGGNSVGGLIGSIYGSIHWSDSSLVDNCYSTGIVSGNGKVGGLVGTSTETIFSNSFWDYESSGQTESAGGVGKSTTEMKNADTFFSADWDPKIWFLDSMINNGYPYLSWQNPDLTPVISIGNEPDIPNTFSISQNYPNPFNPSTSIDYHLPKTSFVLIKMYDILGRDLAVLVKEVKQAGNYSITYDGKNLSSGVYLYSITAGKFHEVKKMVLIR